MMHVSSCAITFSSTYIFPGTKDLSFNMLEHDQKIDVALGVFEYDLFPIAAWNYAIDGATVFYAEGGLCAYFVRKNK